MKIELKRKYMLKKLVEKTDNYGAKSKEEKLIEVDEEDGNLVSSRLNLPGNVHAPCLDIDVPAKLLPSSTPDHYHLYIDVPMDWEDYKKLLKALADAGIIESGYYIASVRDGQSMVRKPGITKGQLLSEAQEAILELSVPT